MNTSTSSSRGIWLAVIVLAGLTLGILAGVVIYVVATPLPAVMGALAVFGGVVKLGMGAMRFLTE